MTANDESTLILRVKTESVDWRTVDEEIVVLDRGASEYLAINPTGARLWPLLVEGATRDELIAELSGAYGIDSSVADRDVGEFLSMLEGRSLLERSP